MPTQSSWEEGLEPPAAGQREARSPQRTHKARARGRAGGGGPLRPERGAVGGNDTMCDTGDSPARAHTEPAHPPGYEVIEGQPQNCQEQEHGDGPAVPHGVHVDLREEGRRAGTVRGLAGRPHPSPRSPRPRRRQPWGPGDGGLRVGQPSKTRPVAEAAPQRWGTPPPSPGPVLTGPARPQANACLPGASQAPVPRGGTSGPTGRQGHCRLLCPPGSRVEHGRSFAGGSAGGRGTHLP